MTLPIQCPSFPYARTVVALNEVEEVLKEWFEVFLVFPFALNLTRRSSREGIARTKATSMSQDEGSRLRTGMLG